MDVVNVLGMDGCISMDTCTLHWHILYWAMLMGRGMLQSSDINIKLKRLLMHLISIYMCNSTSLLTPQKKKIRGKKEEMNLIMVEYL